jgi:Enoyl-CoA hydratase/isomerase
MLEAGAAEDLSPASGTPAVVLTDDDGDDSTIERVAERRVSLPCVIAGGPALPRLAPVVDVFADDAELPTVLNQVARTPLAATAMALLLRSTLARTIDEGLVAESVTYSMLQSGPEFNRWRTSRAPRDRPDSDDVVIVDRRDGELQVTLNRPRVHNAFNKAMRDGLAEALTLALFDETIALVVLRGAGPSFCSGGDLDEFGRFPDPASSHVIRLTRSPARLVARLSPKVVVHAHGACMGAGIELPAFAGRIVASPDARFALPELTFGLVPGAGGTVSLPRRVGRHRTALLGLTGEAIDATTALEWGLIDGIDPSLG